MGRYALIRDGKVDNVVAWDGMTPWGGSRDSVALPDNSPVEPGWSYDGLQFSAPAPTQRIATLEERIAKLESDVAALQGR